MNQSTEYLLKKGYILIPRVLFEEQMTKTKGATGEFEAFILVLTHVNYSTTTCCVDNHSIECHRGESVLSIERWAELFGWKRSRTRYFFRKMEEEGVIEKLISPNTTHIRIPDYDLLIGQTQRMKKEQEACGTTFETFWKKFHEVTCTYKVNIGRARKEWKKLSAHERSLALKGIDDYYDHLRDTKFCMQAATYLSNKAFMNEYEY